MTCFVQFDKLYFFEAWNVFVLVWWPNVLESPVNLGDFNLIFIGIFDLHDKV